MDDEKSGTKEVKGHQFVAKPKRHARRYKKSLGYGVLIVAVVIVAVVLVLVQRAHDKKNIVVVSSVCTSKSAGNLLKQAQLPIFGTEQIQLFQIVQKIKKLPTYQYDPNCLYVVTTYYANAGDAKNAQIYMNDFNKVYNPKYFLSPTLGPDIPGPQVLQSRVAELQKAPK